VSTERAPAADQQAPADAESPGSRDEQALAEAAPAPSPGEQVPAEAESALVAERPGSEAIAPPAPTAEPPAPETFEFATQAVSVSERQAGAAAVISRRGGDLGESSVVWWTSDGSATAGGDYANLGAIVERFAAGEKNRTIHVPIVGDATAESRESFYVNLGERRPAGEGSLEPGQRLEVVIEDDD
jgi:hypothetical protein